MAPDSKYLTLNGDAILRLYGIGSDNQPFLDTSPSAFEGDLKEKIEKATQKIVVDQGAVEQIVIRQVKSRFFSKVKTFFRSLFNRMTPNDQFGFEDVGLDTIPVSTIDELLPPPPRTTKPVQVRVKPYQEARETIWTPGNGNGRKPAIPRDRAHDPLRIETIDEEVRAIIRAV